MTEVQADTILDGWRREVGRGSVYPSPEFWGRVEIPYNEVRRRVQLESIPDIESEIKRERQEHNRENPSFILRVSDQNTLTIQPEKGRSRPVVELARHNGERGAKHSCVLINGDGFDNQVLQRVQANLRNMLMNEFSDQNKRLIVPYAALNSARLNLGSIRPIHITGDRRVGVVVKVARLPESVMKANTATAESGTLELEHKGRQYRSRYNRYNNPAVSWWVMHHAEFAANEEWHQTTERIKDKTEDVKEWTVTESVHRLGSAVFSAEGPDGVRHRWVSSFDQNENPAMYFLAQLPDKGAVRYVTHAIRLLAPKIVQKAREDGRRVFRQGDIFAVETDLTTEDFASHSVESRQIVFQGTRQVPRPNRPNWSTDVIHIPILDPNATLKQRRSIMIYGTGHTAEEVVQTPNGTYIRGTMFHDPILENIRQQRLPEHTNLALGDGTKWYLAVRNSVPRSTLNTTGGSDNVASIQPQQLPDLQPEHVGRKRNVLESVVR